MIKPGDVVNYEGKEHVVFELIRCNKAFPLGRVGLISEGKINWHSGGQRPFMDRVENKRAKYVLISQFNRKLKKIARDGRSYYTSEHVVPANFEQAQDWAEKYGGIMFSGVKKTLWGHGTYKVKEDNTLELVYGAWDSSG